MTVRHEAAGALSFWRKPAPGIANLVWGCLSKFSKVSTEPAHSLISLCKPPVITPLTLLRALMVLLPLTGTLFRHGLGAPCWPHGHAGPTHSWWSMFFRGRSRGTQCPRHPPNPSPPAPTPLQHARHRGGCYFTTTALPPLSLAEDSSPAGTLPAPSAKVEDNNTLCALTAESCQMVADGVFPPDPVAAALQLASHKDHPSLGVFLSLLHVGTQQTGWRGRHIFRNCPERRPLQSGSSCRPWLHTASASTKGQAAPGHVPPATHTTEQEHWLQGTACFNPEQ